MYAIDNNRQHIGTVSKHKIDLQIPTVLRDILLWWYDHHPSVPGSYVQSHRSQALNMCSVSVVALLEDVRVQKDHDWKNYTMTYCFYWPLRAQMGGDNRDAALAERTDYTSASCSPISPQITHETEFPCSFLWECQLHLSREL